MGIEFKEVAPLERQEWLSVKEFLIDRLQSGRRWPGQGVMFPLAMRLLATIDTIMDGLDQAWKKIRGLENQIKFLEGCHYPCPSCGTKSVEPDLKEGMRGTCRVCLMEFSIPLLDDLRQQGKIDIGVTKRIESLNAENSRLREQLTRLQQHVHRLGVYVPPEVMFGVPRRVEESENGQ